MARRSHRRGSGPQTSDDDVRYLVNNNLVKSKRFRGIKAGDRVRVNPRQLKPHQLWMSGHIFEFLSLTTNINNGSQWLDLWGGKRKYETWHNITPQDLVLVRSSR